MKIIILGAGRVGTSVAESLVSEANDITVIDSDPVRVTDLQKFFPDEEELLDLDSFPLEVLMEKKLNSENEN